MVTANRKKELTTANRTGSRKLFGLTLAVAILLSAVPSAHALPSYSRQTGQACSSCHVGGNWPQLTPWGRFFKLSGYTAGKSLWGGKDGVQYVPVGVFGQVGVTWAAQPKDSTGAEVIAQNGSPQAYEFTGELGTKLTDFAGIFYEYSLANQFPGWKGTSGAVDVRGVHFFHVGGRELLVGIDSNNNPTDQDVWNSLTGWGYPYYVSPQSLSGPASPVISSLGGQAAGIGAYALWNRQVYAEFSAYHVANDFYRWMSAGIPTGTYIDGFNPYWRIYWTKEYGSQTFMVGTVGMHTSIFPNSATPSGPTDAFTDYGFDAQYDYMGGRNKASVRFRYIHENQSWNASFPMELSSTPNGNIRSWNVNGTYTLGDRWAFTSGYFASDGSSNADLYAVTDPAGGLLSASPNTDGYIIEVDRNLTQNLKLTAQYDGFFKFNGLTGNIDGLGRTPGDNNTFWLSMFMAF